MINIRVLGRLSVEGRGQREADIHTARGAELFAFLVLESDRVFHRSRIAEQFWGNLPELRARKALNTELWRLNKALQAIGMDTEACLFRSQTEIGYKSQIDHNLDVDVLTAATKCVRSASPADITDEDLAMIQAGVEAYSGDLLESVYSDWCLIWRETLRTQNVTCLTFLLDAAMHRQEWTKALEYGQRLLQLDPLLEDVHRCVIRCHYHNGNRPLALRQFALCAQLLSEELGVEPMDETRRIQETILAVSPKRETKVNEILKEPLLPRSRDGRSPVQKVDMALANINTARNWLEDASRDLREPSRRS